MKTLGYIVTEMDVNSDYGFIEVVGDISEADLSKPTIVVGTGLAKKTIGKISYLHRCTENENLSWTFARNERRNEHESDMDSFVKMVIDRFSGSVEYCFIDAFCEKEADEMIPDMNGSESKCFRDGEMVYAYDGNGKCYGLLLDNCVYGGSESGSVASAVFGKCSETFDAKSEVSDSDRRIFKDKPYLIAAIV